VLRKTVLATFDDRSDAERALLRLMDEGFSLTDVRVVTSEAAHSRELGPKGRSSPVGASTGGAWGALLGALGAAWTATSAVTLPAIGLVAVGPILAAAIGACLGGAAGALFGTLISSGVSENEAHEARRGLARGDGVLVAVRTELTLARRARAMLRGDARAKRPASHDALRP
jgi:uncharacterized membrane protein